jgi:hypothetical protein
MSYSTFGIFFSKQETHQNTVKILENELSAFYTLKNQGYSQWAFTNYKSFYLLKHLSYLRK